MRAAPLIAAFLLALLYSPAARAQTPAQSTYRQRALIADVTRRGARAEALVEFCVAADRPAAPTFGMALNRWRDRNRWPVIQAFIATQPNLQANFTSTKAASAADLRKHVRTAAATCVALPQTLASASADPSRRHAAALAALTPPPVPARRPNGSLSPDSPQPTFHPSPGNTPR